MWNVIEIARWEILKTNVDQRLINDLLYAIVHIAFLYGQQVKDYDENSDRVGSNHKNEMCVCV